MRGEVLARRGQQGGTGAASALISARLLALPEFTAAHTIAAFVGVGGEVNTNDLIVQALGMGKRVAVPWRDGAELRFAAIRSLDELIPASLGLLEPPASLRNDPGRNCPAEAIDLVVTPGVAFDRTGRRLGRGKGYYDRFFRRVRTDAFRVAVGFECQMVEAVPVGSGDEPLDAVVTEAAVYRFTSQGASPDR